MSQVIGITTYSQSVPVFEYKKEAFHYLETLLNKITQDIVMILLNLKNLEKKE